MTGNSKSYWNVNAAIQFITKRGPEAPTRAVIVNPGLRIGGDTPGAAIEASNHTGGGS